MKGELDSDAATVGQLKDAGLNLNAAGEVSNAFVAYDDATLGCVTLSNTVVTNLALGELTEASQDAVTGAQLFAVSQELGEAITALGQIHTAMDEITTGDAGVMYFHVDSTAADAGASGTNALAIGPNAWPISTGAAAVGDATVVSATAGLALGAGANVSGSYSVAIGQGSLADRPNTVWVGSSAARRRIVNVEAGVAGVAESDAVTVGQLRAAGLDVNVAGNVRNAFLAYDDSSKARATLDNTLVTGLRAADLSQLSTDAVVGGQLFETNAKVTKNTQDIAGLAQTVAGISTGDADLKYVQVKSTGSEATANGNNAIAIGPQALAKGGGSIVVGDGATMASTGSGIVLGRSARVESGAGGEGAIAVGNAAYVSANSAVVIGASASASKTDNVAIGGVAAASGTTTVAIGANAVASATNGVALDAKSACDRAKSVSVGSASLQRQIINVAAGTSSTDAVNVGQLTTMLAERDALLASLQERLAALESA
ncbi:hypothetical protein CYJ10_01285 [Cupriavidus pauculus]|uniref:Uncharacterized protein n=2 Tax=Cupriavidus pauculus TaxID=82633 RepID=A0A2N5CID5_9BURK|nr:hypothetical protein CYJ10_01285 [Cupriavidus pauculus]